jgi:hypothetical protein
MPRPASVQFPLLVVCLPILLAGVGCTREEPAESSKTVPTVGTNRPPIITSATILNGPLSLSSPVTVQIDAEDPEREAVSFNYQWYADGTALAGQTHPTLAPKFLRRGQMVRVEIVPADGSQKGAVYRTAPVLVGNTAPKVTMVSLRPQTARSGDKLEAQVEAIDSDHDRVDVIYKWYRNDAIIKEGEESVLDTTGFTARDKIVVEVTAHDISIAGNSLKSEPLVLGNSGPKIVSTPPSAAIQDRFDYPVKAMDPDGDQLTYSLEASPPGMTIGSESGHIEWRIPSDQQGTFHVKVMTKDGQGGLASQEFDLTLTPATSAKPSGA